MKGGRYQYDPVDGRIVDTSREPSREWLSTRDALEHLRLSGLSSDDNRKRLVQWAAAGLLPARALFLRERGQRLTEGSLIPTWVWERVVEGLWVRSFDWQAGSLRLLRLNFGPDLDIEAHGIEFDKLSLIRLAPASAQNAVGAQGADRPIGRPNSTGPFSAADEVILARMQELMDEGCPSPTAAARQLWVEKELKGQDEESAIRRVVRKFRKRT